MATDIEMKAIQEAREKAHLIEKQLHAELDEMATRYADMYGVSCMFGAHVMMDRFAGMFQCAYKHTGTTEYVMNCVYLACSIMEMMEEMGVPKEAVMMTMAAYKSDAGSCAPLKDLMKA